MPNPGVAWIPGVPMTLILATLCEDEGTNAWVSRLLEIPTPPEATGVPTCCCEYPCEGYSSKTADKVAAAAVESFILVL